MNVNDTLAFLGIQEGLRLKVRYDIHDINTHIPFFQIDGNNTIVRIGGYKNHDNAPRMLYWAYYLQTFILPLMTKRQVICDGFYNIQLHDSPSYLENENAHTNCLVWSRKKNNRDQVLIPDIFQLSNYGGKFDTLEDYTPFLHKKDCIGFWGTTTGSRNPLNNIRLQVCSQANPFQNAFACKITHVAQMPLHDVIQSYPSFQQFYTPFVSYDYQMQYRYLLDIPGNTCSWDRIPFILKSRSLLFKYPCQDMCFYHPLLQEKTHFIGVERDLESMLLQRSYYNNNLREGERISQNATRFFYDYCHNQAAITYLVHLFESAHFYHGK